MEIVRDRWIDWIVLLILKTDATIIEVYDNIDYFIDFQLNFMKGLLKGMRRCNALNLIQWNEH